MAKRPEKKNDDAYRQLKKDLSAGTIGSLYIFHGEEAYLRDYYLDQMKGKLIPPGMESFNYHLLPGKSLTVQKLAETVDALPMMSPRTMLVVNDYDIFKAPEGERTLMAQLLEDLPVNRVALVGGQLEPAGAERHGTGTSAGPTAR